MAFRDRFNSAQTAKALMSWRAALALVAAIGAVVVGVPWGLAVVGGLVLYGGLVYAAMPADPSATGRRPDPFTVGEPWRQFVQDAQRAQNRFADTLRSLQPGPIRERLGDIAARIDRAGAESFAIAQRGYAIDTAVNQIDPVRLRSRLDSLGKQRAGLSDDQLQAGNLPAAISSVESQLASADRLKVLSAETVDRLRLTQTRLDELVARAAEVAVGASDTDTYEHDVDNLVDELEGMRLAIEETERADRSVTEPFRIEGLGEPGSTSGSTG